MTIEKSYIQEVIEQVVKLGHQQAKDIAKSLGTLGEPVSPEEQLRRYKQATPEDIIEKAGEKGWEEVNRWVADMERRLAQSQRRRGNA